MAAPIESCCRYTVCGPAVEVCFNSQDSDPPAAVSYNPNYSPSVSYSPLAHTTSLQSRSYNRYDSYSVHDSVPAPYDEMDYPAYVGVSYNPNYSTQVCYSHSVPTSRQTLQPNIYAISIRKDFCSQHEFSQEERIVKVFQQMIGSDVRLTDAYFHACFKDLEIIVFIHGANTTNTVVYKHLRSIAKAAKKYDVVIGYLYPSHTTGCYGAGRRAAACTGERRFSPFLNKLLTVAKNVDIAAHSMGVHMTFNALENKRTKSGVRHFFAFGGAESAEVLVKCQPNGVIPCTRYPGALRKVDKMINFFSSNDWALLGHEFYMSEKSLGRSNAPASRMPHNIQQIDATSFVGGHSDYLEEDQLLALLDTEKLDESNEICHKLKHDGSSQSIDCEKMSQPGACAVL